MGEPVDLLWVSRGQEVSSRAEASRRRGGARARSGPGGSCGKAGWLLVLDRLLGVGGDKEGSVRLLCPSGQRAAGEPIGDVPLARNHACEDSQLGRGARASGPTLPMQSVDFARVSVGPAIGDRREDPLRIVIRPVWVRALWRVCPEATASLRRSSTPRTRPGYPCTVGCRGPGRRCSVCSNPAVARGCPRLLR